MIDPIESLALAISALRKERAEIPFTVDEALAQFQTIVAIRRVWSALPNSRLKEDEKHQFMVRMLGNEPSESHLGLAYRTLRRRRLTDAELIDIEMRQGSRCALCGTLLIQDVSPNLDHIVPVALGGADDESNFQLLCGECNLGKGACLHWAMTLPFFDETTGNEPSMRLRYAVLQRFNGKCFEKDCENCSHSHEMFVMPFVGIPEGGRIIFDNLVTYCSEHRDKHVALQMRRAKNAMSNGKTSFGFHR